MQGNAFLRINTKYNFSCYYWDRISRSYFTSFAIKIYI